MRIEYKQLDKNYLILHMYEDGYSKYGIVDSKNGREYIPPLFDEIKFHKYVNLIELKSGDYRALWKFTDFESYAKTL